MKFTFIRTDSTQMWNEILSQVITSLSEGITANLFKTKEEIVNRLYVRLFNIVTSLNFKGARLVKGNNFVVFVNSYDIPIWEVTVEEKVTEVEKKFRRMEPHEAFTALCFQSNDEGKTFISALGLRGFKPNQFINYPKDTSFWKLVE